MTRSQIIELPACAGDDRPPFILIIDQADDETMQHLAYGTTIDADGTQRPTREAIKADLGALAILAFEETIEMPTNQAPG